MSRRCNGRRSTAGCRIQGSSLRLRSVRQEPGPRVRDPGHGQRQLHDYIPDFIIRLKNGAHLILETKGYDENEAGKVAVAHRWVDAVNAEGSFGTWCYTIARNPKDVPHMIGEMATQTAAPGAQVAAAPG